MEPVKRDWPERLQVCTDQLNLAIQGEDADSTMTWLADGFEAQEACEIMLKTNGLDPKKIELIELKINNFKEVLKNDKTTI